MPSLLSNCGLRKICRRPAWQVMPAMQLVARKVRESFTRCALLLSWQSRQFDDEVYRHAKQCEKLPACVPGT